VLLRSDGVVVNSKALNTDGSRIVSGGDVETVRIWDAVSGVAVGKWRTEHEGNVDSLVVSADGAIFVSYGTLDKVARVVDKATSACVPTITEGVPELATNAELPIPAALSSWRVGAQLNIEDDGTLLTPRRGGSAPRLKTLDALFMATFQLDMGRLEPRFVGRFVYDLVRCGLR
jgi:WD40 repeat protein